MVSNPPFIGNKRMRDRLGDGYVEAQRKVYQDIPDTVDFVMYWWYHSAKLVVEDKLESFGLITTNSITQTFNRKVLVKHLVGNNSLSLSFAIPDHPWIDTTDGEAVRIAMTVVKSGKHEGILAKVVKEVESDDGVTIVDLAISKGFINVDLSVGVDVVSASKLAPNEVTQQVLTEVMETEETVIIPTEQKTFPKQPKEQLAAIRDLLRTNTSDWTVDQIAAQFKNGGKYKNAIAENVERLEWFGILICRETGATKRWQYVEI
ncbi:DNA methyltransferase [Dolichospermum flos-aquae]|uniref:DNA methyltransferase n=1 Tax=Nostocales TaxID=1161 RepID=UPI002D7E8F99|nr:DNA methyltransferase [Dolichospermum flos-aquae]